MSKMGTALSTAAGGAATGASVGGPWGAAIGGGLGLLAGLGMGQDDKSGEMMQRLMDEARGIPLPVLKEYYPELYKQIVTLNPELETAIDLGPSQMAGIATDPALRTAQLSALQELQDIGSSGGMNLTDKANLERVLSETDLQRRGAEGAIMQNLATRGMAGGGQELVQRQMASQGASNLASQQGLDIAAQAQRRALEAIMQGGQLGGQMESQQFGQERAKAEAADAIARFNAANQQSVMERNVGARNVAQMTNAQMAQQIANQNVAQRGQSQMYNLNLPQQQYENQLKRLGLIGVATGGAAEASARASEAQDRFMGGLLETGARAYGAYEQGQKGKR